MSCGSSGRVTSPRTGHNLCGHVFAGFDQFQASCETIEEQSSEYTPGICDENRHKKTYLDYEVVKAHNTREDAKFGAPVITLTNIRPPVLAVTKYRDMDTGHVFQMCMKCARQRREISWSEEAIHPKLRKGGCSSAQSSCQSY